MEDRQTDSTTRGVYWSVVINNPTEEDLDKVYKGPYPPWMRHIKGQQETAPTTGTRHVNMYLHTEQMRLSAISKWLTRANINPLMGIEHRDNWITKYSQKDDTAIANTQFEVDKRQQEGERKQRTMAGLLTQMAAFRYSDSQIQEKTNPLDETRKPMKIKEVYEEEYWHVVGIMCGQDENLIQIFTMPAYKTAWVNTRRTWIQKTIVDRQTRISIVCPDGEISPVSVQKMAFKKGGARRGKRVSKRKAGARKRVTVNKALQPIAQRYICKMKYCDSFALNTDSSAFGTVVHRMRLNSLFDPNLSAAGHRPYGFTQLMGTPGTADVGLYNRYRVISCSYSIYAAPAAGQTVQITALPSNEAVATSIGVNGSALRENPRAKYITQTTGAPIKLLKGKVYLPSLVGRTKSQYMADDRFQAQSNANPLEAAVLNVYLNEIGDATGLPGGIPVSARLNITMVYTCELFDVHNKEQSGPAPL